MQRSILVTAALLCTFAGGLVSTAAAAAPALELRAQDASGVVKIADAQKGHLVTLKFILKSEMGEREMETTGMMVEGDGLVLVSNFGIGGSPFGPAPQATEMKVLVGDDTQGVDAKVIARDTELGLAWVKVTTAPAKPYAFIDLGKGAEAKMGESIVAVGMMGKFFDRAVTVYPSNMCAVVSKPRKLGIPGDGFPRGEFGLPVFNSDGALLGVTTLILPEQEEMQGDMSGLKGLRSCMLLPFDEVAAATKRAKETAATAKEGETPDLNPPKEMPAVDDMGEEPAPAPAPAPAEPKKPE